MVKYVWEGQKNDHPHEITKVKVKNVFSTIQITALHLSLEYKKGGEMQCYGARSKGQLISRRLFGVFKFFQKNERKQVIVVTGCLTLKCAIVNGPEG